MGEAFRGVVIEESLENKAVLGNIKIIDCKTEKVTKKHCTPWVKQWTLLTIQIPELEANKIAQQLSQSLDSKHAWYADFKNKHTHYILFRNKVFKINRTKKQEYQNATNYGISIGIPNHQVDFNPFVKKWKWTR